MHIIILLIIIAVIITIIKGFFEEHPIIAIGIIWGIISLLFFNLRVLLLGEAILCLLCLLVSVYIEYKNKKELAKREEDRRIKQEKDKLKIKKWNDEAKDFNIDVESIMLKLIDTFKNDYKEYFDYATIPYGRALAFISNFGKPDNGDEYYFFKPERTLRPYEVRENGILIAKSGIYVIYAKRTNKEYVTTYEECLSFKDLYKCNANYATIINEEENGFRTVRFEKLAANSRYNNLQSLVSSVLEYKIPQFIRYNGLDIALQHLDDFEEKINYNILNSAVLAGAEARESIYSEQKNYMNGAGGAGYAAEYGNLTVDKLFGKDTINQAQNLDPVTGRQMKDGADRIVNGEMIQTKYYKNFDELWNNAFSKGEIRYKSNNTIMKIEVPRDRYSLYCSELQKRIDAGKINGIVPGTKAGTILRRGFFSYNEAYNIAKAGTIEGLAVDLTNGVITSNYSMTISAILVFALSVWNGKNFEEAAKASLEVAIQVLGRSAMIYTMTMQFSRKEVMIPFLNAGVNNPILNVSKNIANTIQSSMLAKTPLGKTLKLNQMTDKLLISNTVTAAVVFGPDIFKFFNGKISGLQLFKNSAIGVGGIAGGMVASQVLTGAILGPIGMIAGGVLGAMATKSVLDKYIEDDAIEMFYIYKEEYLDIVTGTNLTQKEFEEISSWTFESKELPAFLELMYSKVEPRKCAREYFISCIQKIYHRKKRIDSNSIEESYVKYLVSAQKEIVDKNEIKYCAVCGKKLEKKWLVCPYCGEAF